jgi:hypothetical protein
MDDQFFEITAECEKLYPETTKAFKDIMKQQYLLFCKKQLNYGPNNISLGTECKNDDDIRLSLQGLWFRMNDKINRLKQLVLLNKSDLVNESITDTYQDLSIYNIIAQLVQNKNWGK